MHDSKKIWLRYLQEEIDVAYLYKVLAQKTSADIEKENYLKLCSIENKHVAAWDGLLKKNNVTNYQKRPSVKALLMGFLSGIIGTEWLKELMFQKEGEEVKTYLKLYQKSTDQSTRKIALNLAKDSAGHAQSMGEFTGNNKEPWHRTGSGGIVRNVIYGLNDGLTANFGLIAGVIGAETSDHFILVSGLAGLVADALSMGASAYLAAKSEQEVYEHEIKMEAEEISMMPDLETEELLLIYQSKGMDADTARAKAELLMKTPEKALNEKIHEELGISDVEIKPFKEAWLTGLATAIGAIIPILPFFFAKTENAIIASFIIAMSAHFGVGAARSFFTGKNLWKSGMEMFLVGFGVALFGYLMGNLIIHW